MDEALERLRPLVQSWLASTVAEARSGAAESRSKASPSHSGRFLVRMSGELHEQLAHAAEQSQVSLNRYVTDALAATVAGRADAVEPEQPPPTQVVASQAPARSIRIALAANMVVVVFAALVAIALLVLALERGI